MAHHEPFKALGPIKWSAVPREDELANFLRTSFSQAQIVIDSIPGTAGASAAKHGRARSQTDSAVAASLAAGGAGALPPAPGREHASSSASAAEHAARLRKEWRDVKVSPRDNPHGIAVHKLPAKDGRGSWFARRSVHGGLAFDRFRACLQRELEETLKVQAGPGAGSIRGIGADRRVESVAWGGVGKAEVYLLSAQFPGPTTPRDFVTLLLSSEAGREEEEDGEKDGGERKGRAPRQFMVVSKPCEHPECPERSGFIRGYYESVEVIREIPVDKPLRKVRSSIDLSRGESPVSNASMPASTGVGNEDEEPEMAVEWLMITRSDPGGSVPRFMIEKGTPGGIINDAGRFLKWLATYSRKLEKEGGSKPESDKIQEEDQLSKAAKTLSADSQEPPASEPESQTSDSGPSGIYGMISGALGIATSYASRLPIPFAGSANDADYPPREESESVSSDSSSEHSFASADDGIRTPTTTTERPHADDTAAEVTSSHSIVSDETPSVSAAATQHEKELRKLQERQRKIQEKIAKNQERERAKRAGSSNDSSGGEAALAKLREKHEREVAKQEEKFRKELRKLEEKRRAEERKAEERRRKQAEREERGSLALELERARVERDVALKQVEVLKDQVGELQRQNTLLVAKLGKLSTLGSDGEGLAGELGGKNAGGGSSASTKSAAS
ncbi:Reticulocyte-binding protein 2 a [Pleurostoma richardsiae]|uniref:Reticulocyte-binding protein 2 a n=1 Tax=Pleurostoma richardsiae TaxID=41990 RepID=A0AA38RQT3_9PEZI|nr:Reticulocyte-binding protein 2 a [Pleurostoma richardsiae]